MQPRIDHFEGCSYCIALHIHIVVFADVGFGAELS